LHFKRNILTSKIAFHNYVVCALNGVLIFYIVVHTECVCTQHQSTILLCNAANLKQDYKDLVFVIVCRTENKMCMIHRCGSYPGKYILYQFFETENLTGDSTDNVVYM